MGVGGFVAFPGPTSTIGTAPSGGRLLPTIEAWRLHMVATGVSSPVVVPGPAG